MRRKIRWLPTNWTHNLVHGTWAVAVLHSRRSALANRAALSKSTRHGMSPRRERKRRYPHAPLGGHAEVPTTNDWSRFQALRSERSRALSPAAAG